MSNEETGNGQRAAGNGQSPILTGHGQQAAGNGQRQSRDLRVGADIANRLLDFAASVVQLIKTLPKDATARHIALQLVRASTSGGANYEEARAAESRADFIHKVSIAAKELREAIYWLRLIERSRMTANALTPILSHATQLAAILTASARTARARTNERVEGGESSG